jgi:hypothetical protein
MIDVVEITIPLNTIFSPNIGAAFTKYLTTMLSFSFHKTSDTFKTQVSRPEFTIYFFIEIANSDLIKHVVIIV